MHLIDLPNINVQMLQEDDAHALGPSFPNDLDAILNGPNGSFVPVPSYTIYLSWCNANPAFYAKQLANPSCDRILGFAARRRRCH